QWIRRLDRADASAVTVRTYRLKYGVSTQIAKVLNDLFLGRSAASNSAASQIAPGSNAGKSRLDSLDRGSSTGLASPAGGTGQGLTSSTGTSSGSNSSNPIATAFEAFGDHGADGDDKNNKDGSGASGGASSSRGMLQNVRITADTSNNSIVI